MNENITRHLGAIKLFMQRNMPRILIFGGTGATVGGAVWACKNTYKKLPDAVEKHYERLDVIHNEVEVNHGLDEKEVRKMTTDSYLETTKDLTKIYIGPILVEIVGIAAILGGDHAYKARSIQAAAAYLTLQTMYDRLKTGVEEKYGKEEAFKLANGIKEVEVETEYTDKKGNIKTKKEKIEVMDPLDEYSSYARFFDESCEGVWNKNPELNLITLKGIEQMANAKLRTQGYLFLNDVYSALGIPITAAGQQVGWIYDDENPIGDNYVDFGMYDTRIMSSANRDFVNGYTNAILLDFNVDGVILDKLP
jgi:hypothetical protein